jgi:hypothetical protein
LKGRRKLGERQRKGREGKERYRRDNKRKSIHWQMTKKEMEDYHTILHRGFLIVVKEVTELRARFSPVFQRGGNPTFNAD